MSKTNLVPIICVVLGLLVIGGIWFYLLSLSGVSFFSSPLPEGTTCKIIGCSGTGCVPDAYKDNVILHIEDNGIGIPKEDQPYIFSQFYRGREAYLKETEGLGMSLFLAKNIIEKHNGKLGVRSEGDGRGSTFWFSIKI